MTTSRISISLVPGLCREDGCEQTAGSYGLCHLHESAAVLKHFRGLVREGIVEDEAPPCFDSHEQWAYYATISVVQLRMERSAARRISVDHCRDCTPAFKDAMMVEGRCSHPETVFIRPRGSGDVAGVSIRKGAGNSSQKWESAVMGASGPVVSMPPPGVVEETLERIGVENAPRPVGRPRKKA